MAQITKDTKNIIEAGITPEEYLAIIDKRIPMSYYTYYWPDPKQQLYHLGELVALRGQKEMAEYFKSIGSLPMEWNLDGDN